MTASPRIAALAALAVVTIAASGATVAQAQEPAPTIPPQPSVVSVERFETPVDGWNGWLVWSRRGTNGSYTLIARNPAGEGVSLPVAPQPVPFDASIGPGPNGQPLIVYSQCAKPGPQPTGCDVFRLDPVTGNGGRVTAASSPTREERYPTVWGNKIAFSLSVGKNPLPAGVAVARLGSTARAGRPTVFGPRTERVGGKTRKLGHYAPYGTDLRGGRLAFTWQIQGRNNVWSLYVGNTKGAVRQLLSARTTSTVVSHIGRPAIGARDVIVPLQRTGGVSRSEIVRSTFNGQRRWTLAGGFSAAQTEQFGSALTAVARTDDRDLVIVRRLASDGRWACMAPGSPDVGGCELLRYADATGAWKPAALTTSTTR